MEGVIIDSLDNFMGLEARVVVFVAPKQDGQSQDTYRTLLNPKHKMAIASRGKDRVDFLHGDNLEVKNVKDMKIDMYPDTLL